MVVEKLGRTFTTLANLNMTNPNNLYSDDLKYDDLVYCTGQNQNNSSK